MYLLNHKRKAIVSLESKELTGKDVNYYLVDVKGPKRLTPYTAECEDIIEALGMTFSEGCAFKAIWRSCAARTLGKRKEGQTEDGVYDAEKIQYYAGRILAVRKRLTEKLKPAPLVTNITVQSSPGKFAPVFQELFNDILKNKPTECEINEKLCVKIFRSKECGYESNNNNHTCDKHFTTCQNFGNAMSFRSK